MSTAMFGPRPSIRLRLRYHAKPVYQGCVWLPHVVSAPSCSQFESSNEGLDQSGESPGWNCHLPAIGTPPEPGFGALNGSLEARIPGTASRPSKAAAAIAPREERTAFRGLIRGFPVRHDFEIGRQSEHTGRSTANATENPRSRLAEAKSRPLRCLLPGSRFYIEKTKTDPRATCD